MSDGEQTDVSVRAEKNGIGRYWYLIVLALVALGWFYSWWRYDAFTDENYMPAQPIPYSHRLHAGEYKIPCQYCHFNAQKSRHAGVPPTSVCMGCHDPKMGAVGQDRPAVQKMLELIGEGSDSYVDTADLDGKGEGVVKASGALHWNRVHKLPDHAYFSHEWHVKAGVSCQTCHGPVEDMEVVWQAEDLTMGWCLDCHRDDDYTTLATGRKGLHEHADLQDAEDFQVGTANYDVIRARIRPDRVVPFEERHVDGLHHHGDDPTHAHGGHAEGHGGHTRGDEDDLDAPIVGALRGGFDHTKDDVAGENVGYFTQAQAVALEELFQKYPDLPRWRVPDLPESHRAFYGREMLQNAPTQCSTCHQ